MWTENKKKATVWAPLNWGQVEDHGLFLFSGIQWYSMPTSESTNSVVDIEQKKKSPTCSKSTWNTVKDVMIRCSKHTCFTPRTSPFWEPMLNHYQMFVQFFPFNSFDWKTLFCFLLFLFCFVPHSKVRSCQTRSVVDVNRNLMTFRNTKTEQGGFGWALRTWQHDTFTGTTWTADTFHDTQHNLRVSDIRLIQSEHAGVCALYVDV